MQLHRLAVLALALAVAACGSDDDGGSDTVDLSRARVVIISGDGQRAQVPDPAPQGAIVPQAVVGEAMLPDPLVVRVTHDAPQAGITGISAAVVPEGTPVHWRIPQDGCGEPFGGTTVTDAAGESTNRVILGTVAGSCSVQVGRVLASGEVVIDSTFVYELLPGPVADFQVTGNSAWTIAEIGDSLDLRAVISSARDRYGNTIPLEDVKALPDSAIAWEWYGPGDSPRVSGSGWHADVPDVAGLGYELRRTAIVVDNKNVFCWHFTANLDLTIHGHAPSSGVLRLHRIAEPEGFTYPEPLCSEYEGES